MPHTIIIFLNVKKIWRTILLKNVFCLYWRKNYLWYWKKNECRWYSLRPYITRASHNEQNKIWNNNSLKSGASRNERCGWKNSRILRNNNALSWKIPNFVQWNCNLSLCLEFLVLVSRVRYLQFLWFNSNYYFFAFCSKVAEISKRDR